MTKIKAAEEDMTFALRELVERKWCWLMDDNGEPTGRRVKIAQATVEIDGTVLIDLDNGQRFNVRVWESFKDCVEEELDRHKRNLNWIASIGEDPARFDAKMRRKMLANADADVAPVLQAIFNQSRAPGSPVAKRSKRS